MTSHATRRSFLESAGAVVSAAGASSAFADSAQAQSQPSSSDTPRAGSRPRIAALASTYHYLSHAYHIVGRFLDGFPIHTAEGTTLHKPNFEIASLFIEQVSEETDLGRAKAKENNVRLSQSIADALTLGTGKLAVDGVLLIAEHGDYPYNDRLQKLYPRGKYFREVLEVFRASGKTAPVFIDKHLSYSRVEAATMVDQATQLGVPMMAGSSLPVTWRLPELEIPLGRKFREVLIASRGDLEIFGFHALETLQCMAERRDLGGNPQGVKAVTYLEKDAVWEAGDRGVWSWELLKHALGRSHSVNVGDIKQNTKDFRPPALKDSFTKLRHPLGFVVEYVDGLRATVLILNGHVDDTTVAARVVDPAGGESIVSTLMYLPAPPGASFFNPLVLRIEDFLKNKQAPYPVQRTQLTGGILDVALESRVKGQKRIETPELATINYKAPADSGFIRSSLTSLEPNRLG